jgi:hypothetical protein
MCLRAQKANLLTCEATFVSGWTHPMMNEYKILQNCGEMWGFHSVDAGIYGVLGRLAVAQG